MDDAAAVPYGTPMEYPALDLGPLPGHLGYALRRAQMSVFADFHAVFEALGLRTAQYSVLLVLRHNPDARASQVSAALGILPANFTALLRGLQSAGLVQRRSVAEDRRAVALHLSEAGEALMAQADAAILEHQDRWIARLGADDHRRLIELLTRVA